MKGKSKRIQMSHIVDNSRKVERSMQKSMRREDLHYLKRSFFSSFFSFAAIAGIFRSILTFLFNNTSGPDYGLPSVGPVLPELIRQNNSNRRWYKTHVPKFMRNGLNHLEITQLRQKVYAGQVRYV